MGSDRFELNSPEVAAELLDGEVLAINFKSGMYFSLRGSSAAIWALISAHHTVDQTIGLILPHLPNAAECVPNFVLQLKAQELIRYSLSTASTDVDLSKFCHPWSEPLLEQFDDMQMLLLLDPIHEVSPDSGWPIQKQA
jgi:hypothetical protein